MSRLGNTLNPNDAFGRSVVDIARHNRSGEAFLTGMSMLFENIATDMPATAAFGKFPREAMLDLHTEILAYLSASATNPTARRRSSASSPPRMLGAREGEESLEGMAHDSSDRLMPEPKRKGGLIRPGEVGHLEQVICQG